jgi:DNA-binding NtrC family response regulator
MPCSAIGGNKTRVAEELGLTRVGLRMKLRVWGSEAANDERLGLAAGDT